MGKTLSNYIGGISNAKSQKVCWALQNQMYTFPLLDSGQSKWSIREWFISLPFNLLNNKHLVESICRTKEDWFLLWQKIWDVVLLLIRISYHFPFQKKSEMKEIISILYKLFALKIYSRCFDVWSSNICFLSEYLVALRRRRRRRGKKVKHL